MSLSVKQGGSTVADYYHRLNSLWKEFDAITKLPKTALLTRDPLLDVKDAYATVSREESHRGIPETFEAIDTNMNATSFAAKSYNQNKMGNTNNFNRNNTKGNGPNNYNRGPNHNLVCKNCGFTGHTIERCYELIGYPPGKGGDKQPTACNSPTSFTADQMQKLLNLISDTAFGNTQANMAGGISFFNENAWFNVNFSKFYYRNTKFLVKTIILRWIIDSEANQHLTTSTISMINVVDISNLNITVGYPNGIVATISHVRDLRLLNNVILYDVLIVPGYYVSLLSVNKLTKDSKLFVGFDEDKCYIQDLDKRITLGTGSESGGLYQFDDTKNKSLGNVNTVMTFNVSKDLWHNKLGHLADQVLNVLKNNLNLSKNTIVSVCETCHRAKQTREPFPLSDHKSVKPGELVHLDLLPYSVLNGRSPYELLHNKKPNLSHLSPNDEERATPCVEGGVHSNTDAALVQFLEEDSVTHIGDNILSEGNIQDENPDPNIVALVETTVLRKVTPMLGGLAGPLRCLLSLMTLCLIVNLNMLDMNNAFLYGDLNKDICMSLPLGFECSDKTKVCKLNKALYGLKQAPRQWNAKLTIVLVEHGFVQSKNDYSLYIKHTDDVFVDLLVYVYDFIITGNSLDEIENFKLFLKSKFMIKDLGVMKYFLGIEVFDDSNGICMTQRKYCLELIHEFGLLAAKSVTTPLPENCV
nr:ribonuclease H-like domain-containing protein [Tanacetum cinerariifolium]